MKPNRSLTAREAFYALTEGDEEARRQATLKLLAQVEALSTAVLELAGERKLATGVDPLTMRSRAVLGDFIELPREAS
jgi:hypothetical protein